MDFLQNIAEWLNGLTGMSFSAHGWIAAILTIIGVFSLYLVLLWLVRKSHHSGHDQAVEDYRDPRRQPADSDDD